MNDDGRVAATVAVWAGLACSLVFGVFDANWSGAGGAIACVAVTLGLGIVAWRATAAIWARAARD